MSNAFRSFSANLSAGLMPLALSGCLSVPGRATTPTSTPAASTEAVLNPSDFEGMEKKEAASKLVEALGIGPVTERMELTKRAGGWEIDIVLQDYPSFLPKFGLPKGSVLRMPFSAIPGRTDVSDIEIIVPPNAPVTLWGRRFAFSQGITGHLRHGMHLDLDFGASVMFGAAPCDQVSVRILEDKLPMSCRLGEEASFTLANGQKVALAKGRSVELLDEAVVSFPLPNGFELAWRDANVPLKGARADVAGVEGFLMKSAVLPWGGSKETVALFDGAYVRLPFEGGARDFSGVLSQKTTLPRVTLDRGDAVWATGEGYGERVLAVSRASRAVGGTRFPEFSRYVFDRNQKGELILSFVMSLDEGDVKRLKTHLPKETFWDLLTNPIGPSSARYVQCRKPKANGGFEACEGLTFGALASRD